MDSRFVNYRFSFRNFANYRFWAHFASKGFPIPIVQIVLQITVSPATNQKEKKKTKSLVMTIGNLSQVWPGCTWTPNENFGKLQRLCIQASKILGTRNLPRPVCNFSSNSSCGLEQRQQSASLLQLSCINLTVLLFSLLCRYHLAVYLSRTNNFSLTHTEFGEISFIFATTALYSSCQIGRLRT